ncbi:hypothetical protein [uncultured Tateyamaria sp.]|uniref:hypothetical protein n=1 Tax=uncultured Tateyamaria sp. TaxID=455651 RepID=UPI00260DE6C4|nr:hypothetical protein [uncultured Tateyamaria sp.]
MNLDAKRVLSLPIHYRRTFLALLVLIAILLAAADLYFLGQNATPGSLQSSASQYIQSIVAAIIVALFTFALVAFFLPSDNTSHGLAHLSPTEITPAFEKQLEQARAWQYRGNFGRYLRGKVLPTLSSKTNMRISACIIDPRDKKLCEEHSRYRAQINGIDKGRTYTLQVVQYEVLTTILICAWYVSAKGASIDLYLTSVFDPVRTDASDKSMIVTVEDRRRPALLIDVEHFMYEHFSLQMSFAQRQGERVNLEILAYRANISELTEPDVSAFFSTIGMGEICRSVGEKELLAAINDVKNPYES